MSKQATALQPLSGRVRRRWSTLAVATALGASGLLAASNAVLASTDTTAPGSDATAPAATEAEGTAAEGTAPEGTAAGVSLPAGAGEGIEIAFIQGVIGDEFYISMDCGVQEEAARLGATVTVTSLRPVRCAAVTCTHGVPVVRLPLKSMPPTPPVAVCAASVS